MVTANAIHLQEAFQLLQLGRLADAELRCAEMLTKFPKDPDVLHLAALIARAVGDCSLAEKRLKKAIALAPARPDLFHTQGLILSAQHRYLPAIAAFERAIAARPDFADAYNNLGIAFEALNRLQDAGRAYERCLSLRQAHPQAWFNLGRIYRRLKDYVNAETCIRNALSMQPKNSVFVEGLAELKLEVGDPRAAIAILNAALEQQPGDPGLLNTLSIAICESGDEAQSEQILRGLLRAHENFAPALCNLGAILNRRDPGNDEAGVLFRRAMDIAPESGAAQYLLSFVLLSKGCYSEGFRLSGWRQADASHPSAPRPARGERVALYQALAEGRDVIVYAEQGLGDNLFFFRFLQGLPIRRGRLFYAGDLRLSSILAPTGLFAGFVGPDESPPSPAVHVLSADLPFHLGVDHCPPPLKLIPDASRVKRWAEFLGSIGPKPYIGLTWRAGISLSRIWEKYLYKEVPLEALAAAVSATRGTLIALQRQPEQGEIDRLKSVSACNVFDASAVNEDLDEMLALLAALDAQVGVSNTNVHLRAGLGLPSHVLVPAPTEWRWSASPKASGWFPLARVYRESADGWREPLEALRSELVSELKAAPVGRSVNK